MLLRVFLYVRFVISLSFEKIRNRNRALGSCEVEHGWCSCG
jgi:hypothetical protein